MGASLAIDCQCGGRVSHGRVVPTVKVCIREYLSVHNTLALGIILCNLNFQTDLRHKAFVHESCRLTVVFSCAIWEADHVSVLC